MGATTSGPFLPRAFSVLRAGAARWRADAGGVRLEFMLEAVGPGTQRLCELGPGDGLHVTGPLGLGFTGPEDRRRALLCGGGVGTAPLAIWQDELLARGEPAPALLGFRDAEHAPGATLLHNARIATDDGSHGHHGLVTDLLAAELDADAHAVVYACGPPPMLEAVRALCAERDVPASSRSSRAWPAASAPASAASCRCAPAATCACASTGPCSTAPCSRRCRRIDRGGTSAACASPIRSSTGRGPSTPSPRRRAFGDALIERFPFAAFVSKTITLAPRDGNPPPRLYETPAGMINSIGLPNKGLRGYLEHDLPELARLPVPLVTNVMGSTASRAVRAGRGARRARRGRRARAQRLLPERLDRPRHRRRPRPSWRRDAPGAPADRQAR